MKIEVADDYFIILDNIHSEDVLGQIFFEIFATSVETTRALGLFQGSFRIDFRFGQKLFLVLNNPSPDQILTATIFIHFRWGLYLVLGILFEILLYGFSYYVFQNFPKKKKKQASFNSQARSLAFSHDLESLGKQKIDKKL